MFQAYFHLFAYLSGTKPGSFDPSGHLTCGLLASGLWLQIYLFILESCSDFYSPRSPLLQKSTYLTLGAVFYHAYGVFYTVLVFHDLFETVIGMGFGLMIYFIVFFT